MQIWNIAIKNFNITTKLICETKNDNHDQDNTHHDMNKKDSQHKKDEWNNHHKKDEQTTSSNQ